MQHSGPVGIEPDAEPVHACVLSVKTAGGAKPRRCNLSATLFYSYESKACATLGSLSALDVRKFDDSRRVFPLLTNKDFEKLG